MFLLLHRDKTDHTPQKKFGLDIVADNATPAPRWHEKFHY